MRRRGLLQHCLHWAVSVLLGNSWNVQERHHSPELLRWYGTLCWLLRRYQSLLFVPWQLDNLFHRDLHEQYSGAARWHLQRQWLLFARLDRTMYLCLHWWGLWRGLHPGRHPQPV